jgi:hypothetical protein
MITKSNRAQVLVVITVAVALLAGCPRSGSSQLRGGGDGDLANFDCRGRRAEYFLVGGFVAAESGIIVKCDGNRPTLTRWTAGDDGSREEATHNLTPAAFEELWRTFEDAGWRNLSDCVNPKAKSDAQVYTFEIAVQDKQVSFVCQGKELPFPFDRLVTALDVAAAEFN